MALFGRGYHNDVIMTYLENVALATSTSNTLLLLWSTRKSAHNLSYNLQQPPQASQRLSGIIYFKECSAARSTYKLNRQKLVKDSFCNSCNISIQRLLLELELCWYLYTSWSSRQQFWPMDKSKQRSDASLINKNYQKSQRILSIGWTWKNYTGKIYRICNIHLQ